MAKKVITIEVGYSLTKVCEVDYQVKNPKVYNCFTITTPEGILEDGNIKVEPVFVETITRRIHEQKITTKGVIFSITSSKIASREAVIPFVKENRIKDLVNANAAEYFPIDLTQYQLTHSVNGIEESVEGKRYKLTVLAAPNQLIRGYEELAKALELQLVAIDYSGNSIYHAVKEECAEGIDLIIKADERASLIMVLENGTVVLSRTIPYGIDEAIQTITTSTAWGTIANYTEAIEFCRRKTCILRSISGNENKQEDTEEIETEQTLQDKKEITMSFISLVGGISRVIDYYYSKNQGKTINRMFLTGIGADFSGLSKLLSNEIGEKVKVLNKLEGINLEKVFKEVSFGEYICCIGAAINPVQFGNRESGKESNKKEKESKNLESVCIGVFVVGIALSIAFTLMAVIPHQVYKVKKVKLENRIVELTPAYEIYQTYLQEKEIWNQMNYFNNITINRNKDIVSLINEMENNMPASLIVRDIAVTVEGISMNMTVGTKDEVAKVLSEFKKMDRFLFADTTSINETESEIGEKQFSVNITLIYAPIINEETVEE